MESWLKFDCWMRNIIVPLLAAAQSQSLGGLGDASGTVPHMSWWTSHLAYPHPHLKHIKDLRLQPKLQQFICSAVNPCVQMRTIITILKYSLSLQKEGCHLPLFEFLPTHCGSLFCGKFDLIDFFQSQSLTFSFTSYLLFLCIHALSFSLTHHEITY